jgi:hypothetical protein
MVKLYVYPEQYAIVSLQAACEANLLSLPCDSFFALIRDKNELTIVMLEANVPETSAYVQGGYRVVMLDSEFKFDVVGVMAKCATALAEAGIPILTYSSYTTDIFIVQEKSLGKVCDILQHLELTNG